MFHGQRTTARTQCFSCIHTRLCGVNLRRSARARRFESPEVGVQLLQRQRGRGRDQTGECDGCSRVGAGVRCGGATHGALADLVFQASAVLSWNADSRDPGMPTSVDESKSHEVRLCHLGEVQPVDAVVVGIERLSHPDPGPLDNQADRVFSFWLVRRDYSWVRSAVVGDS
jgi:hypothetical protein